MQKRGHDHGGAGALHDLTFGQKRKPARENRLAIVGGRPSKGRPWPALPCRQQGRRTRQLAGSGWRSGDGWFREQARGLARSFHSAPRVDVAAHRMSRSSMPPWRARSKGDWPPNGRSRFGLVSQRVALASSANRSFSPLSMPNQRNTFKLIAAQRAHLPRSASCDRWGLEMSPSSARR